jgi:HK97 family phage major capsid protein
MPELTAVQKREVYSLVKEMNDLSLKRNKTREDESRSRFLGKAIHLIEKCGMSMQEVNQMDLNDFEDRHGFERTNLNPTQKWSPLTSEKRAEIKVWQDAILHGKLQGKEERDMVVGNPINAIGTFTGLGFFVPAMFLQDVFNTMRWYDALFDPAVTTQIETTTGNPIQIGTYDDSSIFAAEAAEGSDQSANGVDLQNSGEVTLGAWSYRTPMFRISRESFQDVEAANGIVEMFKMFAAQRIARIVGKRLLLGSGVSQPQGLIPALIAKGASPVIAVGSSGNTGGAETGVTSIGSADMGNLYAAVDPAYRVSPKCAWLMNDNTFAYLQTVVTKQGLPLVSFRDGAGYILNKPVRICPSMANLGSAGNVVLFGDLSYFVVRCAKDPMTYVKVFQQAPGLVEKGEIGLRMFVRYDSNLLYTGGATKPPIAILQNHS